MHLAVDGVRVDRQQRRGSGYVSCLPNRPMSLAICSRTAVPAELGITRAPRSLGVAVRQVAVRQGAKFTQFDADDERLTTGVHGFEPADKLRWTAGCAALPTDSVISMWKRLTGGFFCR